MRDNAMSSINARSGKPPTRTNNARSTNMARSPVAIPVTRDRRFIVASITRSGAWTPERRTSKRPQRRCVSARAPAMISSACAGNSVSACKNSSQSPDAAPAPAFIWRARPRGALRSLSTSGAASVVVASRLPPSASTTSCPARRRDCSGASVAVITSASSSVGMMMESFIALRVRTLCQRAAATAALPRGAAVAVVIDHDGIAGEACRDEVLDVHARPAVEAQRQAQHLIEVAVVDVTLPIDALEAAAHHRIEIGVAVRLVQQGHVILELALRQQGAAETLFGLVGERVEAVEDDAESIAQVLLVRRLQTRLRRGQVRPLRVVHQVQHETAVFSAIAQCIERAQPVKACIEYTLAALTVDVLLQITRQRGRDLHLLNRQEFSEVFLPWLGEYSEIAAVDDMSAFVTRGAHELAKVRIEFGRAARDVERGHARGAQECEDLLHCLMPHQLRAARARVDVTVQALLIAAIAEIDLQRLEPVALQRREAGLFEEG